MTSKQRILDLLQTLKLYRFIARVALQVSCFDIFFDDMIVKYWVESKENASKGPNGGLGVSRSVDRSCQKGAVFALYLVS
jgi:hypothetical protein